MGLLTLPVHVLCVSVASERRGAAAGGVLPLAELLGQVEHHFSDARQRLESQPHGQSAQRLRSQLSSQLGAARQRIVSLETQGQHLVDTTLHRIETQRHGVLSQGGVLSQVPFTLPYPTLPYPTPPYPTPPFHTLPYPIPA